MGILDNIGLRPLDLFLKINVQRGLEDTMFDLFLGLVGGIAGFLINDNFTKN